MLHIENKRVRELLLQGNFGLEKENRWMQTDGSLSLSCNYWSIARAGSYGKGLTAVSSSMTKRRIGNTRILTTHHCKQKT